jgi:hypothetical protein
MLISVAVDRERLIHTDGVFKDMTNQIHDVSTIKALNYLTDRDWYGVTFINDTHTSCYTEELLHAGAIKEGDPGTKSYKQGQLSPEERYRRQEAEYKKRLSQPTPLNKTDMVILKHGRKLHFVCKCGCEFAISRQYCASMPAGNYKAKCPECNALCENEPE